MIVPSPSQQALAPQGGAVARGRADYPISWRQSPWFVLTFGMWDDPADDERGERWARDVRTALRPWRERRDLPDAYSFAAALGVKPAALARVLADGSGGSKAAAILSFTDFDLSGSAKSRRRFSARTSRP